MVEGRFLPHGGTKYYCTRFIMHIDKELLLPVGNLFYDEKDELLEDYVYHRREAQCRAYGDGLFAVQ